MARHVLVALIAVKECRRAQRQRGTCRRCIADDVDKVALQKPYLVAHRARGVDDEGNVSLRFHRRCRRHDIVVRDGLSHRVPAAHHGVACHQLVAYAHLQSGGVGCLLLVEPRPAVGLAVVVGLRLPDGHVATQQFHVHADERLPFVVAHGDGHTVVGVELPIARLVAILLRLHQCRPEGPVMQVVPLTGSDDAGSGIASTAIATTCSAFASAAIHLIVARLKARFAVAHVTSCRQYCSSQHHCASQPCQVFFLCFHCSFSFLFWFV